MKKIYTSILVLFLSYSTYGQTDPDLLGQWYLHYMEINGTRTYVPPFTHNPTVFITFNNNASSGLPTSQGDSSCNHFIAEYEVNNTNTSVNLTSVIPTLTLCMGDTFEPTYISILTNTTTNVFDYTVDIPEESLTMIDLSGKKLVYGRQVLSTEKHTSSLNSLKLYPNPVKKELFITDFPISTNTSYTIYNLTGNSIISEKKLIENHINVNALKAGVYFLKVTQNNKISMKKFIKI
ncbi:T9SS type A sorting domain-containing protein [uncultured Kordia sp.]|uniref:T9SS type A sorting domain-containing protein n=1 Tax=uncultured Kordia sp. TaxID=507699 RepID=UPI002609E7FE|nr:T9SS type A sorting domain-containing protein [uncultured Kordia sp.]